MSTSAERPLAALVAILVLFALLVLTSLLLDSGAPSRHDVSSELTEASLVDVD